MSERALASISSRPRATASSPLVIRAARSTTPGGSYMRPSARSLVTSRTRTPRSARRGSESMTLMTSKWLTAGSTMSPARRKSSQSKRRPRSPSATEPRAIRSLTLALAHRTVTRAPLTPIARRWTLYQNSAAPKKLRLTRNSCQSMRTSRSIRSSLSRTLALGLSAAESP